RWRLRGFRGRRRLLWRRRRREILNMARMTVDGFAGRIADAVGSRLVTLLVYGSAARDPAKDTSVNTLLLTDSVDDALFGGLAAPVRDWLRAGHPPPLILTEREWREAADAFPIEYEDIRDAHRILAGRDPWAGVTVQREHVRRQLEHELMGKLVHLRQAYAAYWEDPKRLADALRGTAAGFFTMLRAVLRLAGRTPPAGAPDVLRDAARTIGFTADGLERLAGPVKLAPRDPLPAAYLRALARTADYVNRMERTSS
ncbi:MAG: hypothetical protein ACREME_11925, partial [Gemmatimonadales bacterium]